MTPAGFEEGGRLFGIGLDSDKSFEDQFEDVEGTLSPNRTTGEPIFIYCLSASGAQRPLTVFNNGGTLASAGLEKYAESESALPEDFPEMGIINLPHFDNLLYSGPGSDMFNTTEERKAAIRDPGNWEGSNDTRYGLDTSAANVAISLWTSLVMVVVGVSVMASNL